MSVRPRNSALRHFPVVGGNRKVRVVDPLLAKGRPPDFTCYRFTDTV